MDSVDFIINNTDNEDQAIQYITKHAKDVHGKEVVDELINASTDPKTFKEDIVRLARTPKPESLTPGLDQFHKTGKVFSDQDITNTVNAYKNLMAKTGSVPISAIRSLTHLSTAPIETELSSKTPTEEGTFTTDLGPVAGTVTDLAVTGSLGAGINKLAPVLKGMATNNAEASLVQGDIPKSMKQELIQTPRQVGDKTDIRKIAETADKFNLTPYLANPTKILRKLTGEVYNGKKITPGLIGEKTNELTKTLKEVSSESGLTAGDKDLIPSIADNVKKSFRNKYAPTMSGSAYNEGIDNQMVKEVDSFFKPKTEPYASESRSLNRQFEEMNPTVDQLVKLKRSAQSKAYEFGKLAEQGSDTAKDKHEVYNQIWKSIDDYMYKIAESASPEKAQRIRSLNSDISELMDLHNIVQDAPIVKGASAVENILGAGITGAGISAAGGNPLYGTIYPLVRGLSKGMTSNTEAVVGAGQAGLANIIQGRYMNPSVVAGISSRSDVDNYVIPMNSQEIISNKDMVLAKIRKEFGNDTAQTFASARSPEQIRAMIRTLKIAKPQIFTETKYNNVDGYIDPAFKQAAINDIINDKGSPSQNALKMETLLHEGRMIGL